MACIKASYHGVAFKKLPTYILCGVGTRANFLVFTKTMKEKKLVQIVLFLVYRICVYSCCVCVIINLVTLAKNWTLNASICLFNSDI